MSVSEERVKKSEIIWRLACNCLEEICSDNNTTVSMLDPYFHPEKKMFFSLDDVLEKFAFHAQNSGFMSGVIQYKKNYQILKQYDVLGSFSVSKLSRMTEDDLCSLLREKLNVRSEDSKRNCWRKWSNSIIDSARFLSEFSDLKDFNGFIRSYQRHDAMLASLPLYLSARIRGIGFALACDTLKELGYTEYPKPDKHIKDICQAFSLSANDDISVFNAIRSMAVDCGETPYRVDKVLWLICSGFFYDGMDGNSDEVKIYPTKKAEFITRTKSELASVGLL